MTCLSHSSRLIDIVSLEKALPKPKYDRTLREEQSIQQKLQMLRNSQLTCVFDLPLNQQSCDITEEEMARMETKDLTPKQQAFVSHVLPIYLEQHQLRESLIPIMGVYGMDKNQIIYFKA